MDTFSRIRESKFNDAKKGDGAIFKMFHKKMLESGIYLACSSYETGFISSRTTDNMIEETIQTAKRVMKEIAKEI